MITSTVIEMVALIVFGVIMVTFLICGTVWTATSKKTRAVENVSNALCELTERMTDGYDISYHMDFRNKKE